MRSLVICCWLQASRILGSLLSWWLEKWTTDMRRLWSFGLRLLYLDKPFTHWAISSAQLCPWLAPFLHLSLKWTPKMGLGTPLGFFLFFQFFHVYQQRKDGGTAVCCCPQQPEKVHFALGTSTQANPGFLSLPQKKCQEKSVWRGRVGV